MATNQQLQALIRDLAADARKIVFTSHAREQMAERNISFHMALETLRRGWIVRPPEIDESTGDTKCRMEYYCAGDEVRVVVAIRGLGATTGVVVTAFMAGG